MDSLILLQMLMGQQNEVFADLKLKTDKLEDAIESIENEIEFGKHYIENAERYFRKNLKQTIVLTTCSFRPLKKLPDSNVSIVSFPSFKIDTNEVFIQNEKDLENFISNKRLEIKNWEEILNYYNDQLEEIQTKKMNSRKFLNFLEIELDMYLYNSFTPNFNTIKKFTGKTVSQLENTTKEFVFDSELLKDAELIYRHTVNNSQSGQLAIKSLIGSEVAQNYKNKYSSKKISFTRYVKAIYQQLNDNNTFFFLPNKVWIQKSFLATAQKKKNVD